MAPFSLFSLLNENESHEQCKHFPCGMHQAGAPRCLIPRFNGAILSLEWKDALWDKFVMAAPRPRTPSEQQYSDRKLRSRS
jgi:hypothetical protein